jgi:hypothetical protein
LHDDNDDDDDDDRDDDRSSDFYVGARIRVVGRTFVLDNMDEYTAKHMETNVSQFPMADRTRGMAAVKAALQASPDSVWTKVW